MKNKIIWGLIAVFVIGAIIIVYRGRPVQQLSREQDSAGLLQTENNEAENSAVELNDDEKNEQQVETPVENSVTEPAASTQPDTKPAVINSSVGANNFTMADVAKHNTRTDCWSAVNGGVYDLTSFVDRHPGGVNKIIMICGIDGSSLFDKQHGGSSVAQAALGLLKIGNLK